MRYNSNSHLLNFKNQLEINFNMKIAFAILFKNAVFTISKSHNGIKIGRYLRIHRLS